MNFYCIGNHSSLSMENLTSENFDQLGTLLLKIIHGWREEVEEATQALNRMSENICQFIKSLMEFISCDRTDGTLSYRLLLYSNHI